MQIYKTHDCNFIMSVSGFEQIYIYEQITLNGIIYVFAFPRREYCVPLNFELL